jgi:hypothetical protein
VKRGCVSEGLRCRPDGSQSGGALPLPLAGKAGAGELPQWDTPLWREPHRHFAVAEALPLRFLGDGRRRRPIPPPPAAGLSHLPLSRTRPHGSRRAASGAPHHEGLGFRRETRPHPEERTEGARLEGWAAMKPPTAFCFKCDSPARKRERWSEFAAIPIQPNTISANRSNPAGLVAGLLRRLGFRYRESGSPAAVRAIAPLRTPASSSRSTSVRRLRATCRPRPR